MRLLKAFLLALRDLSVIILIIMTPVAFILLLRFFWHLNHKWTFIGFMCFFTILVIGGLMSDYLTKD